MIAVFVAVAVLLVAFGGLLAAADSALGVLSRADLVDLAAHHRAKRSLLDISSDLGRYVNALNFMRSYQAEQAGKSQELAAEVQRQQMLLAETQRETSALAAQRQRI